MSKKNSNKYIILYIGGLVVVVAAILAFVATSLQSRQYANILLEKKSSILNALGVEVDRGSSKAFIEESYEKHITDSYMVDMDGNRVNSKNGDEVLKMLDDLRSLFASGTEFPVFEGYNELGQRGFIFPLTGSGLWGPIWGYIALEEDCNTIIGAVLDHAKETPGLGAELSHKEFYDQFAGKQIFNADQFVSITLTKGHGSSQNNPNAIDAISGGTLTSNGIRDMISNCLGAYKGFFQQHRAKLASEADFYHDVDSEVAVVEPEDIEDEKS